jgi:hypothetical protein
MARLSLLLVRCAGWVLPDRSALGWGPAMRAELEVVPPGRLRLHFACGCVAAALRERLRLRAVPIVFRILGLALVAVTALQAGIESAQWLNGNEGSRHAYLGVVASVLALAALAILRLTATSADVRGVTLGVGTGCGVLAAGAWAVAAILPASMPRTAVGAVLLGGAAALAAFGVGAALTRSWRQGWLCGLVAAATTSGLTLAVAEVLIQRYPERIPDIVGPVMPPGSLASQVLRENRIEIVDGYVVQLFLGAALCAALVVSTYLGRRRSPA